MQASEVLRLQSILRLLMSGRPMLTIMDSAEVMRFSSHPDFKPAMWNTRQGWRDAKRLEVPVMEKVRGALQDA
jgi:hypothetical protein